MSSVIPLQTVAFIDAYEKSDMRDGQARCDRSTTFRELRGCEHHNPTSVRETVGFREVAFHRGKAILCSLVQPSGSQKGVPVCTEFAISHC